jgi:hypothetical protein
LNRSDATIQHWFLEGAKAKFACGALTAELDVQRPMDGLHLLQVSADAVSGRLMAVDVNDSSRSSEPLWIPSDVYTRGGDLVATYREPAGQPFHLQMYWRALAGGRRDAAVLEAIVSIQTPEWEAYPFISLSSSLDGCAARLDQGGVNFQSQRDWGYVEASLPGDFAPGTVHPASSRWTYGKLFMERGVIRRLRLRGAFVPIAEAEDAILQIRASFESEPPPLTA